MNIRTTSALVALGLTLGVGAWYCFRTAPATTPHTTTAQTADPPAAHVVPPVPDEPKAVTAPAPKPVPVRQVRERLPLQGPANITAQLFRVDARRDTLVRTAGGCAVQIPAHAFADAAGNTIQGHVTVAVKEVLKPIDFVLGNMTTTYNGKPLESGGSFSITASAKGQVLALAEGKVLNMAVPSRAKKAGMKLFAGKEVDGAMEWTAPEELVAPEVVTAPAAPDTTEMGAIRIAWDVNIQEGARTNVMYWAERKGTPLQVIPSCVNEKVSELAFAGEGLWLKRDSSFEVCGHTVHLLAQDSVTGVARNIFPQANVVVDGQAWAGNFNGRQQVGINTFQEDPDANYVFRVKRLGWANIDRLMYDKRTKPVDLVTRVANGERDERIMISLVMKSHGMYLPGYRKADGTFGFSHSDAERMCLPIGAKGSIVATAERDGKPWFAVQEVTITEKEEVRLELVPTTREGLREALLNAL